MSFSQRCEWETFLVEALHRESPPGYTKPNPAQVIQCDRAVWTRHASTVESVRQRLDGAYPVGEALLALRSDPNITLYLAPLAKPANQDKPNWWNRSGPYLQQADKVKGKKGKGQSKGRISAPKQLIGKWRKTPQGEPICFAPNTSDGCSSFVPAGERCPIGAGIFAWSLSVRGSVAPSSISIDRRKESLNSRIGRSFTLSKRS